MKRSTEVALGLALMGGFLTAGCGSGGSASDPTTGAGGTASIETGIGGTTGAAGAGLPGSCGPGGGAGGPATGGVSGSSGGPGAGGGESPPPPDAAARLVAPLSGSLLSTNQPTFYWQRGTGTGTGTGALTVELCSDRPCTHIVQQFSATGSSATAPAALAAGHVFWRVRGAAALSATWEAFIPHRTSTPSSALATRPDYDADGFGDFALDDRVILGGPNGYERSFPLPQPTSPPETSYFVEAGDLNGDGFGDILRLDYFTAGTSVGYFIATPLLGSPTGFTIGVNSSTTMPAGFLYDAGAAGDVNGDGYADFLFKTRYPTLTYMGGAAAISEGPPPASETALSFYAFGADYDADGFADAANMNSNTGPIIVTPGGPAGFDASKVTMIPLPTSGQVGALATIDANGDGYADLAVATSDGVMLVLDGSAAGLGAPTPVFSVTTSCSTCSVLDTPLATGDFNGDGRPDLLTQEGNYESTGGVTAAYFVHFGTATGFSPTSTPLSLPDNARVKLDSISDVNGDGFEDVTVGLTDTITQPSGFKTYSTTKFMLLLGGPDGLKPAP
jgi:hypothetical protein